MSLQPNLTSKFLESQKGGILILDSGIGSISFFSTLNRLLPGVPLTALADQKFFPYGEKSEQEIVDRLVAISDQLVYLIEPATILVACNTASTTVLPALREKFHIPIVGIVPAIKPAAEISKSKKIALLATPGTVKRAYIQNLIDSFASDCEILRISCSNLAKLAEQKIIHGNDVQNELGFDLKPLRERNDRLSIDTIILGCTHFTFLKDEIVKFWGSEVTILDPIESVSLQVKRVNNYHSQRQSKNILIVSDKIDGYLNLKESVYGIDDIIFL